MTATEKLLHLQTALALLVRAGNALSEYNEHLYAHDIENVRHLTFPQGGLAVEDIDREIFETETQIRRQRESIMQRAAA